MSAERHIEELGITLPSGSALGASSLRGGLPVILKAVVEVVP